MKLKTKLSTILLSMFLLASLTGCAQLNSYVSDVKGSLVGNSFNIEEYDNFGNLNISLSGEKVDVSGTVEKVKGIDPGSGNYAYSYELSSVVDVTIDGKDYKTCGNTVIFADKSLTPIENFEMPENIETKGGNITSISKSINGLKNTLGTAKTIVIYSQMGVPIKAYAGNEVYAEVPSDLPKMTKINIDGKPLYIHRCNFNIFDSSLIEE